MSNQPLLEIRNLKAGVEGRAILNGIDLQVHAGEVHAIMGPNGSGKSTLASVIAGREGYEISEGTIAFKGQDLLELEPDKRAHLGLFLAFQYPVEIPGVNTTYFLKSAINEMRKARGEKELDAVEFLKYIKTKAKLLDLPGDFLKRSLNVGFSGGEKKRNEIFQMAALEPIMAVLDETDSGLDIDALKVVANGVNRLRNPNTAQLVITHYQRLLDYIVPDVVHVLHDGRIIKTGPKELALELEDKGYDWVIQEAAQTA
ncbi:Fe-S cluster assembly ATPase SufC [Verrucomicrobia bacterium]|jgi:Fe-S cluster assembly ATP-binding protein|nr:Fe-S cluster assembly ATPase SufC [Verrucomicrobiota bacterium]MDG1891418.1 Fe-S cluster assembly ATPase SufC [Verrucomicrobiota bacterium]